MAKKIASAAAPEPIIAFKGFDAGFVCRDMTYEVGKTYKMSGKIEVCDRGFHACENPFDIWGYYPGAGITRPAAEVVLGGKTHRQEGGDTKIAAAEIRIRAEIKLPDIIKRGVEWILKYAQGNTATGDRGHAAATGDSGHAAATGKWGIAASLGPDATAKAGADGWIALAAWEWSADGHELRHVRAAKVGGPEGIQADVVYRLTAAGEFEEVAP